MFQFLPSIRSEVSSDVQILNYLSSEGRKWIPNENTIRPKPEIIEKKNISFLNIHNTWYSLDDYILYKVFGKKYEVTREQKFRIILDIDQSIYNDTNVNERKKKLESLVSKNDMVFIENAYPYDVEGNHWVLWYGTKEQPYSSQQVTEHIQSKILKIIGENVYYDFIWYNNPKMSVPEFFHVHVFWFTSTTSSNHN